MRDDAAPGPLTPASVPKAPGRLGREDARSLGDTAPTRPLLDKLGVKPGSRVAIVDLDDPGFVSLLRERTADIVKGKPREPVDLVFMGATDISDLRRVEEGEKRIARHRPNVVGC